MFIPPKTQITIWLLYEHRDRCAFLDSLYTHKVQAEAALRWMRNNHPDSLYYLREMDTQPHGEGQP